MLIGIFKAPFKYPKNTKKRKKVKIGSILGNVIVLVMVFAGRCFLINRWSLLKDFVESSYDGICRRCRLRLCADHHIFMKRETTVAATLHGVADRGVLHQTHHERPLTLTL